MLSDMLTSNDLVRDIKDIISPAQYYELIQLMSDYRAGMRLYPGAIKRRLNVQMETVYRILRFMENASILEAQYRLFCRKCQQIADSSYSVINELPDYFACGSCHLEQPAINNAVLVFIISEG